MKRRVKIYVALSWAFGACRQDGAVRGGRGGVPVRLSGVRRFGVTSMPMAGYGGGAPGLVVACAIASLICAGSDRSSVFRQEEPRTSFERWVAHHQPGGRSRLGVCPARHLVLGCQAVVISAQRKPASSLATAVAATTGVLPAAVILWNLPHRRCCAAQDRAMVSAVAPR